MIKQAQVTCPVCQVVSAKEDVKDDFKVRELVKIREQLDKTSGRYTAKEQVAEHVKNLQLLKEQYQNRLEKINANDAWLHTKLVDKLQSNKRKLIAALEEKCAATELSMKERIQNSEITKDAKEMIVIIDNNLKIMKDMSKTATGDATADVTKRFARQLANFSIHDPPEVYTAVQQLPPFLLLSAEELDEIVQRCFAEREDAFDAAAITDTDYEIVERDSVIATDGNESEW